MDSIARDDIEEKLSRLFNRLTHGRIRKAGFPGADDLDYSALWRFFDFELNNIGDPEDEATFVHHSKQHQRVAALRDLRMPGIPIPATPKVRCPMWTSARRWPTTWVPRSLSWRPRAPR